MARLHTGRHKVLAAYRSYHGATADAITMTGDPRRWGTEPGHARRRALLRPVPVPLARSTRHDRGEECERALQHLRDLIMVEGPQTIAAIILETVVGTNGILVPPPGYLAGVRALCDEYGIVLHRRRGDGRLRPLRRVVRRRPLGRHARPDHLRQGRQLRLRAARRRDHLRRDRRDLRSSALYPGGLTYSGHPLACACAVASINIFKEEGIVEHARAPGRATSSARSWREIAERHPSRRRGARPRACSGRSSWSATARRASRSCRTTPPARTPAPMNEFAAACKQRGLWPFTHFNRTARRAAVHDHRGGRARGAGDPRRGPGGRGRLRELRRRSGW